MARHSWNSLLSEHDQRVVKAAGYDDEGATSWDSRGIGSNPIVLVVDMQRKNAGEDVPILDAVRSHRTAMGEIAWNAVREIEPFLSHAREQSIPVAYTRSIPETYDDPTHEDLEIVSPLTPADEETVIDKSSASAFHGTNLISHLVRRNVDTLILTGATTSGCIRATAVDATSHGYHVVVPQECVFDRIQASHEIGLFDMWMKYAEVLERGDVESYLTNTGGSR